MSPINKRIDTFRVMLNLLIENHIIMLSLLNIFIKTLFTCILQLLIIFFLFHLFKVMNILYNVFIKFVFKDAEP